MSDASPTTIKLRLQRLEAHLEQENPVLLKVVKSFRTLDDVAYRLGVLTRSDSFATKVPWWPLVSLLGTFSSGKSTFINHYLGQALQRTGNQAVDDKFTVICFSSDGVARTLPGLALDADPRFPFYQISSDIEAVASGEGRRVDAYLQLKTCPSEKLRAKIVIDSPGFDADAQRTSTLRITDHIIDLSDLVLVMFDARHPEPGAMQDTLQHLVADTISRPDSNKFLYVLNQIDATAREDNPEEVFAAWQRALAQAGLTAGRFYRIYNPDAAIPIDDAQTRARFESKRDEEMAEIHSRMEQIEVERAYRIIGVLEKTAKTLQDQLVPGIRAAKELWKRRVLWLDGIVFGLLLLGLLAASISGGYWEGLVPVAPPWLEWFTVEIWRTTLGLVVLAGVIGFLHYGLRRLAARTVVRSLKRKDLPAAIRDGLVAGFLKNTRLLHSSLNTKPVGWGRRAEAKIGRVLRDADGYIEELNDRFTNPSGDETSAITPRTPASTQPRVAARAAPPPPTEDVVQATEDKPAAVAEPAASEETQERAATG